MSLESSFWYFLAQKIRPFFDVDMNGKKISGLPVSDYPTENSQAATKKYHDDNLAHTHQIAYKIPTATDYPAGISTFFTSTQSGWPDSYGSVFTFWVSGSRNMQIFFRCDRVGKFYVRQCYSDTWGDWATILHVTDHDITARHPVAVIKTSVGSAAGSYAHLTGGNIVFNRKSFFPQMASDDELWILTALAGTNPNDYIGRIALWNDSGASVDYWLQWDYLS